MYDAIVFPALYDMSREVEHGVSLYSRKVMITPTAPVLPKWLRFLKGVVDSEDVPLNLSREFMQDHQLIRYSLKKYKTPISIYFVCIACNVLLYLMLPSYVTAILVDV